jgi:hypothetical protein
VGDHAVNFDAIYDDVFVPAINAVRLPEGGMLQARRTDKDFFSGDIKYEMYRYLEYSRFALADISGLNFNVAYEIGARHRARASGTAIFRLTQFAPPFDINSIKAFPYDYHPDTEAAQSRELISRVLIESLVHNRPDSPVRLALGEQRESGKIDELLVQAENEIRRPNWTGAMDIYRKAVAPVEKSNRAAHHRAMRRVLAASAWWSAPVTDSPASSGGCSATARLRLASLAVDRPDVGSAQKGIGRPGWEWLGGDAIVAVVQAADFRRRHDLAGRGRLDGAGHRAVFCQRKMRTRAHVVRDV